MFHDPAENAGGTEQSAAPNCIPFTKLCLKKPWLISVQFFCLTFWCGFYPQVAYRTVVYKSRTQIEATAWNGGPMSSM